MKTITIILLLQYLFGCSSPINVKNLIEGTNEKTLDSIVIKGSMNKGYVESNLCNEKVTITVSYAAIACGCPQWFQTKFKDVEFLEGVERFYLEPANSGLLNANGLWDGVHLPLTLKLTGRFSKEKELPLTYYSKAVLDEAKIFWYEKLVVISQPPK